MFRFRYTDADDAAAYPGWHEVDVGNLDDVPTDILLDIEDATGYRVLDVNADSPTSFMGACMRRELKAMLATQFIGVRLTGIEVRWPDFRPKVVQVERAIIDEPEADQGEARGPADRANPAPSDSAAADSTARSRKAGRRPSAS